MMYRRTLITVVMCLLLMALGASMVLAQGGEEEPIVTSASRIVGFGSYVAAEAYGVAAGEDVEAAPAQAIVLPYAIYPAMNLMSVDDFVQPAALLEDFTFAWSLAVPDGSTAELLTNGPVAIFFADVEGSYDLTLTATDANGNVGEVVWRAIATSYVGSGYLEGPSSDDDQCIDCHADHGVVDAWMQTAHATAFSVQVDGMGSDHFSGDCLSCHTTGFNTRPEATNGGFDDIAAEAGWSYPEEMVEGTWAAMLEAVPEVAAMANVQCESCHGPGYAHVFEGSRRDSMINTGVEYGVCAQCHAAEPYHPYPTQWELSGHGTENARAFTYPIGEDHASCVRCHSGVGYIDWAKGLPEEDQRTDYQTITCAVCHAPHSAENPGQLRVFDTVLLPDGTDVTSAGSSATCMSCHNTRLDPIAVVEGAAAGERFSTPHYSTAGELMASTGGYTWGMDLPTSAHGRIFESACVSCHMASSPGTSEDGEAMPGHNTVGEHTFAMVSSVDGTQNIASCQECHDGATSFAFEAFRDYDGDGAIETNPEEIAGLQEILTAALGESGVAVLDHYPYFEIPEDADLNMYGAVYNLKFSTSGGSAAHNLKYVVSLLQLSVEQLTGEAVPNAYILAPQ